MEEISIKAEELFHLGALPVTNSMLVAFIISISLILFALLLNRNLKRIPGKVQTFFEIVIEGILSFMDTVFHDRHKSEKYLPLISSIFFFVILSNWSGLLPVVGSVILGHYPLAIISVVSVNAYAISAIGFKQHAGKFFNFQGPIEFFVGILELISEFVKIVSFSFRLFGNIFAGEVLLIVVGSLLPYAAPLPFLFLEVFVGFIQALIFSMLTMVFIGMSVEEHHAH
jgi:F-type H+-transporting ATPase subunit a